MEVVVGVDTVSWPAACPCCGQRPSEIVPAYATRRTFFVLFTRVRRLGLDVPYCATCAERVRERTATPWGLAILVFVGLLVVLAYVYPKIVPFGVLALLTSPIVIYAGAFLGARAFVRRYRRRALAPLPGRHDYCDHGPVVEIASFDRQRTILTVRNEAYARQLESARGRAGSG